MKNTFRSILFAGVSFGAALASPAMAAETGTTLGVSANVSSSCVVSSTALAFPTVDVTSGGAVDGTGAISVTCTSGTAWSASADAGSGADATLSSRKMTSGANLLDYGLYTNSGRTSMWGDGTDVTNTATIDGIGTGTAQAQTIYGRVTAGQTSLPAGAYADTVAVTVTYL